MNSTFLKKSSLTLIFLAVFLNCCLYKQKITCFKQKEIKKSEEFVKQTPDTYFEMCLFIEELVAGRENKVSLEKGLKELTCKELLFAENSESKEAFKALVKHFFSNLRFRSKSIEEPSKEFSILRTLEKRKGDCLSIALIFLILSEKHNLPVYPVLVPSHIFLRFDNGHYKKNIELLKNGREISDETYKLRNNIPEQLVRRGLYLRNLAKKEFFSYLLLNSGTYFIQKNQTDKGRKLLEQAIDINSKISGAHYNLGRSFMTESDFNCAIYFFKKELKINPYHKHSLNNRGIAYFKLGQISKAKRDFEKALKIDPFFKEARQNLLLTKSSNQ